MVFCFYQNRSWRRLKTSLGGLDDVSRETSWQHLKKCFVVISISDQSKTSKTKTMTLLRLLCDVCVSTGKFFKKLNFLKLCLSTSLGILRFSKMFLFCFFFRCCHFLSSIIWTGNFWTGKIAWIAHIVTLTPCNVTAWRMSLFRVFLIRIFAHSEWIRRDREYSVRMRENMDQKNSEYGHFYAEYGWQLNKNGDLIPVWFTVRLLLFIL